MAGGAPKKRGLNSKDSAIMLLKTNEEKVSLFGSATMSMELKGLFCDCHYMYEKKRS